MKKLLKPIIIILSVVFLFGCASQNFYVDKDGKTVEITNPKEQCVLYKILGTNVQYYKGALFAANYAALKKDFYTTDEAMSALGDIEQAVNAETATVGSVINSIFIIAGKASKVGAPEIFLVAQGLKTYANDTTPIDECTRYKLKAHIAEQKMLVSTFIIK